MRVRISPEIPQVPAAPRYQPLSDGREDKARRVVARSLAEATTRGLGSSVERPRIDMNTMARKSGMRTRATNGRPSLNLPEWRPLRALSGIRFGGNSARRFILLQIHANGDE